MRILLTPFTKRITRRIILMQRLTQSKSLLRRPVLK